MNLHKKKIKDNVIFRKVQSNGTSRQLNLTRLLKDWQIVRITVEYNDNFGFCITVEDVEQLGI